MNARDVLICTVGTSLLGQVQRLEADHPLRVALGKNNPHQVAQALLQLAPSDRTCGAEINSVNSIVANGSLSTRAQLHLLVSDTEDGLKVGRCLELYFRNGRCPIGFREVNVTKVEGLDDANPRRFRTDGLRELVRAVGGVISRYGAQRVAINATGGYKAQISFAGLIGQALEVPVYYMFERFSDVVELPPQPVSLDFGLWLDSYELFRFLSKRRTVHPNDLNRAIGHSPDPRLEPLLERLDGELIALSAMGELFHQQFIYRFQAARERLLPPAVPMERRHPPAQDTALQRNPHLAHVDLSGLSEYLQRVFEKTPYIRRFHAFYTNPDLPEETHFALGNVHNRQSVTLVYSDGTGTARLEVELDTTEPDALKAVVADLNQRFASG